MIIPDALLLWSLEAVKSITNLIWHCLRINTETPKLEQSFPYKWVKLLMMDNESCNICNSWAVTGSLRRAFVLYSEHFKCFLSNIHTLMKTLGSSWASVSGTKHTVFVDDPSWATAELISENAKNISFVSHYSASTTAAFRWSHGINVKWLRTSFAVGVLCELNPFELSLFICAPPKDIVTLTLREPGNEATCLQWLDALIHHPEEPGRSILSWLC